MVRLVANHHLVYQFMMFGGHGKSGRGGILKNRCFSGKAQHESRAMETKIMRGCSDSPATV